MKKYLNQFIVIAALIIVGCSDPCKDIVCGPGSCDDGLCICPDGYEGNSCETLVNEQYFGLYNVTQSECTSGTLLIGVQYRVEADTDGGPFDVKVTMLVEGLSVLDMEGTLQNGKLDVSLESTGPQATIKGDFTDSNTFSGVYDVVDTDTCNLTMTK